MQKEITVRRMRFDDLDRVYELELKLFPNPWPKSFFENDLRVANTVAFVVESKNSIIGYSIASCADIGFHITNIAVDEEYQRRGIGTRLLRRLEAIARERGCHYIYLEVRTNNAAAMKLYKNHGYSILFKRKNYYIDGDDAYVMDKELD